MDSGLRGLPTSIDVKINFVETGDRSPGHVSNAPAELIDDWSQDNGTGNVARAAGGPVYPGMTISDWRTTSGQNEVMIQQPGYVLTEAKAKDALANARGRGDTIINVYGAEDPQRTANLIGMSLRAASAMQGA
jgi:hypothetical protein